MEENNRSIYGGRKVLSVHRLMLALLLFNGFSTQVAPYTYSFGSAVNSGHGADAYVSFTINQN
jgi:hypothetical protein